MNQSRLQTLIQGRPNRTVRYEILQCIGHLYAVLVDHVLSCRAVVVRLHCCRKVGDVCDADLQIVTALQDLISKTLF